MENIQTDRPVLPPAALRSRSLQGECKLLRDRSLWETKLDRETIYTRPLEPLGGVALPMTRYHGEAVGIIPSLPATDRSFYQIKVNRFKQPSIWCVRRECSEGLLDRLKTLPAPRVEPLNENHVND